MTLSQERSCSPCARRRMALSLCALALLLCARAVQSQSTLNPDSYPSFFAAEGPAPADSIVLTGRLEVMAAVPMHVAAGAEGSPMIANDTQILRDYILHYDNGTRRQFLLFELFPRGLPPAYLHNGDLITVEGVSELAIHPHNPRSERAFQVYAIGLHRSRDATLRVHSRYAPAATTKVLDALFVLVDFADAPNACQTSAPSGVSGADFLDSLLYTGRYHDQKNIRGLYREMSNGHFDLAQGDPATYRRHRIAGPYTFSQFKKADSCDANYMQWRDAAKERVQADGYDLSQYGTIIVISPMPTGCYWGGRATLSSNCVRGATTFAPPLCFASFLMCVPFVVAHEMGHNIGLEHSGADSANTPLSAAPNLGNVYGDGSCLMGNRNAWNHANAHKMYVMGWLDPSRVLDLDPSAASQTVTLTPTDVPDGQAAGTKSVVAFADVDTSRAVQKTYILSVRSLTGYVSSLAGILGNSYLGGVNIHYSRSDNPYSWFYTNVLPGNEFVAPSSRFEFRVVSHDSTTNRVTLQISRPSGSGSGGAPAGPTLTYAWHVADWSACSVTCGYGQQSRAITCQSSSGFTVTDSNCVTASKPSGVQSCFKGNCVSYGWATGPWGSCSASCGSGTQSRPVSCQANDGSVKSDYFCSGPKPPASQSCPSLPACASSAPTYSWRVGDWSACSASCGSGVQTRAVSCVSSRGGASASDSLCSGAGAKPPASRGCPSLPTCVTWSWSTGAWSDCSSSCGSGTQTRTVSCRSSDNQSGDASHCAGAQPAASRSCPSLPACLTYSWRAAAWSACSNTCGSGTQARAVSCVASDGSAADAARCPQSFKPALSQPCPSLLACPTFAWSASEWQPCPVSCGNGTQSRTVVCKSSSGATQSDATCAQAGPVPARTRACPPLPFCVSYSWTLSAYGPCTSSCGVGTQTRTATCVSSQGQVSAEINCPSPRPSTSRACPSLPACPTYQWSAGAWSACSSSCGTGLQTRRVTCVSSTGVTGSDSLCGAAAKPAASQPCPSLPKCPSAATGSWAASQWGPCSAACGYGTQSRSVRCAAADGSTLTESGCSAPSRPLAQQACYSGACATAAASWVIGPWGGCVVNCPEGGQQSRVVACVKANAGVVPAVQCDAASKPPSSQPCNPSACSSGPSAGAGAVTYSWGVSSWGACSRTCGAGVQTRQVSCLGSDGTPQTDASKCRTAAPVTTQPCSLGDCPPQSAAYAWTVGVWSPCNSNCGGGLQYRAVACRATQDNSFAADALCSAPDRPVDTQGCNAQPCGSGAGACSSSACNGRGVCNLLNGRPSCSCFTGYSGADCRTGPRVDAVAVTQQPGGELVAVWNGTVSANATANVTIFLVPDSNITTPVAVEVPATGRVLIASASLKGLSGSYRVEVAADAAVRNQSQPFFLFGCHSDTDCGHGQCQGFKCLCDTGYTGQQCDQALPPTINSVDLGQTVPSPTCGPAGTPSADGSSCVCDASRLGPACDQQYVTVQIGPFDVSYDTLAADPQARTEFEANFINDMTSALGLLPTRFQVKSLAPGLSVTFYLLALPDSAYGSPPETPRSHFQSKRNVNVPTMTAQDDLQQILLLLDQELLDPSSRLYRGSVTSRLRFTNAPPSASSSVPTAGSSSSSSNVNLPGVITGSVVGAACLALVVAAAAVAVKRRRAARAAASTADQQTRGKFAEVSTLCVTGPLPTVPEHVLESGEVELGPLPSHSEVPTDEIPPCPSPSVENSIIEPDEEQPELHSPARNQSPAGSVSCSDAE